MSQRLIHMKISNDIMFSAQKFDIFPCLLLDETYSISEINDCFLTHVSPSSLELKSVRLTDFAFNSAFIDLLNKVVLEGAGVFSGSVYLSNSLSFEVTDCICLLNKSKIEGNADSILCVFTNQLKYVTIPKPLLVEKEINYNLPVWLPTITIHTDDGRLVYISESVRQLLGYTYSELPFKQPNELVFAEDRQLVEDALMKLNSGLNTIAVKYRMLRKDGAIIWVETTSYRIEDLNKQSSYIVNITHNLTEYNEFQLRLKHSEERYHKLVMNLPVGVVLIDLFGNILEANFALRQLMQVVNDSAISGYNILCNHAMVENGVAECFKRCIATKEVSSGEIDRFLVEGHYVNVFWRYSFIPQLDSDGNIIVVIGNVLNLTDLHEAEIENKRQADFLSKVVNSTSTIFFVKDENHKWVHLNNAFIDAVGLSRDELIGKSDYDIFPAEQAKLFWEKDDEVFEKGQSTMEVNFTGSNSKVYNLMSYRNLYIDPYSNKKYIVGFAYNISDIKKAEDDLKASVEKYQQLFDNANDLILTMDIEGRITNANKKALKYFKLTLQEIQGLKIENYIYEADYKKLESAKEELLSGNLIKSVEIRAHNHEDKTFVYEVKLSLIYDNQVVSGYQSIFSDITQRYEANRKLEKYTIELKELNETKDKFFSIIAHDLRSPYSSIIGFAELILEDYDNMIKSEILDYIKIIKNSAKNSLNLLENLLTWSRLKTNRMPFTPEYVELAVIADEVISVLQSLAFRKNITIDTEIDKAQKVFGDKNMINSILHNLIMNSIKFTPLGGKIKIQVYPELLDSIEFVRVSVSDTGIGMDEKQINEVLTSPRPASRVGTDREPGTGLGLILIREMAERHGGTIKIESNIGKGSVFSFLLPLHQNINTELL